jgi:hypothetical protein
MIIRGADFMNAYKTLALQVMAVELVIIIVTAIA